MGPTGDNVFHDHKIVPKRMFAISYILVFHVLVLVLLLVPSTRIAVIPLPYVATWVKPTSLASLRLPENLYGPPPDQGKTVIDH